MVLGFEAILKPAAYLNCEILFQDRMTGLIRKNDSGSDHDELSLDEYVAMKHILISRTGSRFGVIDEWLEQKGLERRIALIVPHFLSAPFIVAKTDLLLSLPRRIAEQFVGLAPLRILEIPIELPDYDLVMVWHPLRQEDSAHRWLRDQISAVCRDLLKPAN